MAFTLNQIKNADIDNEYRLLRAVDPEINERLYARRKKGALYRVGTFGVEREWTLKEAGPEQLGAVVYFRVERGREYTYIPEHEPVLFLGNVSKYNAKILWKEKICFISRSQLSAESINR